LLRRREYPSSREIAAEMRRISGFEKTYHPLLQKFNGG
jgi:hypothetical protein